MTSALSEGVMTIRAQDPATLIVDFVLGDALVTAPERPLTPGEALAKLFMDNADRGANAANSELVAALRQRAREIQALADPSAPRRNGEIRTTPHPQLPETTAQE